MKKIISDNSTTYIMNTLRGFRHMMVCLEKNGYTLADKDGFFNRKYIYNNGDFDVFNTDYCLYSKTINLKLEEI